MPKQIASVEASKPVTYRHTHLEDITISAFAKEELPNPSPGLGVWEAYTKDNKHLVEDSSIEVLVGKSPLYMAVFIKWPKVSELINLKYGYHLPDGQYRILEVDCGTEYLHVYVEKVGDIDPTQLIHVLTPWPS